MNEALWLDCDSPDEMLLFLGERAGERKARLYAVACCLRDPLWCAHGETRRVILLAEEFADARADERALRSAGGGSAGPPATIAAAPPAEGVAFTRHAARAVDFVCRELAGRTGRPPHAPEYTAVLSAERRAMAYLARDIFGNPFREVPFATAWRTDTVCAVARQMYGTRDFRGMPILADALQDADCDEEDVLRHCRREGPHARGCWVVDLVLGKE